MNPQIRHAQRACEAAKARQAVTVFIDEVGQYAVAEKDMAKRLGGGLLDPPSDWYDHTPDRGPQ